MQEQRRSQLTPKWFSRITTFFRKKHVHQQFEEGYSFYISWRLLFHYIFHKPVTSWLFTHYSSMSWSPLSITLSVTTSHILIFLSCIHHFFLFSYFCFMNKMIQQQQQHLYPYCIIHHHSKVSEGTLFSNLYSCNSLNASNKWIWKILSQCFLFIFMNTKHLQLGGGGIFINIFQNHLAHSITFHQTYYVLCLNQTLRGTKT